ncbi:MAG: hypothetical protein IJG43_07875 [Acidaminococcaceae bacterium]|nr:hypothetical protein [Acidaminococcaceae bacterium]
MATEKTKEAEAQVEKKYVSYCIPATFIDQKYTDALNKKYPDRKRVVVHTRNADRSINWEESLFLAAESKSGKPRLNPMTEEQKEKQGLDAKKDYYIVNFSEDHKDKVFINKRTGTDENGKGIYEQSTRELNEQEFAATMKAMEPWHNYARKEEAGKEQAVAKEAEKAPKAEEKAPKAEEKAAEKAPKKVAKKKTTTQSKAKTQAKTM